MRRSDPQSSIIENIRYIIPAVILGSGFGIFVHGYWLIDHFPIDSRRLLYATVLTGLIGMGGYFLLFRWMRDRFSNLPSIHRAGLVGAAVLIGAFLFFASTEQWRQPSRYVTIFLPVHTLEFSISSGQETDEVSISWFTTSLGEVSYSTVQSQGWIRENDRLILASPSYNRFHWEGRAGETVQIVFQSSSEVEAIVAWDGREETLTLPENHFNYQRSFNVPFYASRAGMILLGILPFSILSVALCLIVWEKRFDLLQSLHYELFEKKHRFTGQDSILLVAIIVIAFLLRVPNLENLYPAVDEYSHLNAAKQITQGIPNPVYSRSLWVVTLPVSLAFKVFGYEIWAARLAGILFNVLAIVPLYLIAIRINRPVAILSVLLYATSPWVIALSRIVREYAYYPFYYYWIIYGIILFVDGLPDRFRVHRDWKKVFAPSKILLGLLLAIPPLYAIKIDPLSTFQVILIAYAVLVVFVFLRMDLRDKTNLFLLLMTTGVLLVLAYVWFGRRLNWQDFNTLPLAYFFANPPQQWYYNRFAAIPGIGLLGALIIGLLIRSRNFIPSLLFALFAGFLGFFMFFSIPVLGPRHLTAAQLCYIILTALGLYVFWVFLRTSLAFRSHALKYITLMVLGMLVMNTQQVLLPLVSRGPYIPITEHYHPELGQIHEYLLANARKTDVLIATKVYSSHVAWTGKPEFHAAYTIWLNTQEREVFSVINQHDSGWIVLDKIWLDQFAFPPFETFSKINEIEYVGLFGDEYLWHWRVK